MSDLLNESVKSEFKFSKKKERPKKILITGASSGIGAALSQFYAAPGITLALVALNKDKLDLTAEICRNKGATVYIYVSDVTDNKQMQNSAQDFLDKIKTVDLVIANAGISMVEDENNQSIEIVQKVMSANFLGVVNTFSPFLSIMKQNNTGALVVISSIAAYRGTPNSGVYSASKAAVNVWTESLRLRLQPYSIKVSTLCLGFVNTGMTEELPFWMPGILTAETAANKIAAAIKSRKRCIIIPWTSKLIWTFLSILPGFIYDKLILLLKANPVRRCRPPKEKTKEQ